MNFGAALTPGIAGNTPVSLESSGSFRFFLFLAYAKPQLYSRLVSKLQGSFLIDTTFPRARQIIANSVLNNGRFVDDY